MTEEFKQGDKVYLNEHPAVVERVYKVGEQERISVKYTDVDYENEVFKREVRWAGDRHGYWRSNRPHTGIGVQVQSAEKYQRQQVLRSVGESLQKLEKLKSAYTRDSEWSKLQALQQGLAALLVCFEDDVVDDN